MSLPEEKVLRAKTLGLRTTRPLNAVRQKNSQENEAEALAGKERLKSYPRRFVFELTNACNLNCRMCGRNAADFRPTFFDMEWLPIFEHTAEFVEEVTLMGWGEPTIHPHFADFLKWAHRLGLRKYFCTNGMRLDKLLDDIFQTETDIIAVSMDGAAAETNEAIRRGADFKKITANIEKIADEKARRGMAFPYMNFVFTAMAGNIRELPELVRLAANLGLDEVKVVYLTAFERGMSKESLFDKVDLTREVFENALQTSQEKGVALKLPHLIGEDPAGQQAHKICYTGWRDFFLGSDGFVRPCMSTSEKLFPVSKYVTFEEMWNSEEYRAHRARVNTDTMKHSCLMCYQSSFANWNKRESFFQIDEEFSPEW